MKKTRTILSFVMAVAMIASIFALGTSAAYKDGDVLYSTDFSDFDVSKLAPIGYASTGGALKTVEIKDGALHIDNSDVDGAGAFVSGRYGSRVILYDIPDDVKTFSVTCDIVINEIHNKDRSSYGPGLLIADNGVSDPDATASNAFFSMFWMRLAGFATSGIYNYGDTSFNFVDMNQLGFCEEGSPYTIEIFVDATNPDDPYGMFKAVNKKINSVFETDYFYYNSAGANTAIGIYNNGCDITVDNIKVTYGNSYFTIPTPEETVQRST